MQGKIQTKLRRLNGEITKYKNAEYIPLFYFLPKSVLDLCGELPHKISRFPYELLTDWKQIEIIESDQFTQLVKDVFHYLVWPYMGLKAGREIYSGNHPAWKFSHSLNPWIQTLYDMGILPSFNDIARNITPQTYFGYLSDKYVDLVLKEIVPITMERFRMNEIIDVTKEYPCFEDFDDRSSRQKTAHHKQWYHLRTKHPMISLESFQERYKEQHDGAEWDVADERIDIEGNAVSQDIVDRFMSTISEKDKQILEFRMQGHTYEEIADKLGYKTHSAVLKRVQKIGIAFERYANIDYGFKD